MPTRALLIRNPAARRALPDGQLPGLLDAARAAGWEIDAVATEYAGHATELARGAAAHGFDVVIVHGGDGTVNEAVNGMAGSQTALAVLRGGTANVWAKETRIPKNALKAIRVIISGERRRIDLGRAGERYFLLMAGAGIDAAIVPRVSERMKRRLGALAYIIAGAPVALRRTRWDVAVTIDGKDPEPSLYWLIAGNTRSYGGVINLTHRAAVDDGMLDVALMRRGGVWRLVIDGLRAVMGRHDRSPNVRYQRARRVEVAAPGVPVQVDGEYIGETPVRFEAVPAMLDVIVPAGLRSPLFSGRT